MINFSINITGIVKLGLVNISFFFILMLKLYILRHGKAVKPENSQKDFDRKLNKKGTAQVNQVGYMLKKQDALIHQIISSGAKRTEETTGIMNYHLKVDNIYFEDHLYLADRETIQKYLIQEAKSDCILLVGHNFGLTDFVNHLTGDNLLLSTGMLVQINFNFEDWSMLTAKSGTMEDFIEPQVHSF